MEPERVSEQQVIDALFLMGGATSGQVADKIGCSRKTADKRLKALLDDEKVTKDSSGVYRPIGDNENDSRSGASNPAFFTLPDGEKFWHDGEPEYEGNTVRYYNNECTANVRVTGDAVILEQDANNEVGFIRWRFFEGQRQEVNCFFDWTLPSEQWDDEQKREWEQAGHKMRWLNLGVRPPNRTKRPECD